LSSGCPTSGLLGGWSRLGMVGWTDVNMYASTSIYMD